MITWFLPSERSGLRKRNMDYSVCMYFNVSNVQPKCQQTEYDIQIVNQIWQEFILSGTILEVCQFSERMLREFSG